MRQNVSYGAILTHNLSTKQLNNDPNPKPSKRIDDRKAFREAYKAELEKLKRTPAKGSPGRAGRRTP